MNKNVTTHYIYKKLKYTQLYIKTPYNILNAVIEMLILTDLHFMKYIIF